VAEIVAGFLLPHDPLIPSQPDMASAEQRDVVMAAYVDVAERLQNYEVDTVIVIGDDHYTLFGPQCLPRCLIGIGDVEGPVEPWLGIPRRAVMNNTALAEHIMHHGFDNGVDWAVAKTMVLDHSAMVPIHYTVPSNSGIKAIPIYLNSAVEPLISNKRVEKIGALVGDAIRGYGGAERVAVLGTGGMSHWVGMSRMGQINKEWDIALMDIVRRGDITELVSFDDEEVLNTAGNGALEIKNWIAAMAIMGELTGELIAYEPIHEWVCGCGFFELRAA